MKKIIILFFIFSAVNSYAFKPGKCEPVLNQFLEILIENEKLKDPIDTKPGNDYKYKTIPNACLVEPSIKNEEAQWLLHMNKDEINIIVQKTNLTTFEVTYFGPFKSAYKK